MTEILSQKLINIQTQNQAQPLCCCFSNDNSELLIGLNDGTYQILQLPHYILIAYFTLRQIGYPVHLEYSACGNHFFSFNYVENNHVLIKIENRIIPRLQDHPQLVPALISTFVQYEIPVQCIVNKIIINQLIYDVKKLIGFSLMILAQNNISEFRIDLNATQISNETLRLDQLDSSEKINDIALLLNKFLIVHIKQKLLIYQKDYINKGKYIFSCTFNPLGDGVIEKQLNKTLFPQRQCILQLKFGFDLIPFQTYESLEQYKLERLRIEAIVQDFKLMQQQVQQLTKSLELNFSDTFAVQLNQNIIYVCKLIVSDLPVLIKQEADYDLTNELHKTYQITISTDNYHKILSEDQVGMIGYYQNLQISIDVFQKSYSVVYGSKSIVKTYPIMPDCSILQCIFQNPSYCLNKSNLQNAVELDEFDMFNGEVADFSSKQESLISVMLVQQIQAFATCQSVITNKLLLLDFQRYQEYSGYFPGFQQYDKPTIYYEREDEFDRVPDDEYYDETYYFKGGEKRSKEKCIEQIDRLKGFLF